MASLVQCLDKEGLLSAVDMWLSGMEGQVQLQQQQPPPPIQQQQGGGQGSPTQQLSGQEAVNQSHDPQQQQQQQQQQLQQHSLVVGREDAHMQGTDAQEAAKCILDIAMR